MSLKKMITTYPTLFGALIGLVIFCAAITVASVPWLDKAFDSNKRLVQAVWFTAALFVVWVSRLWRWQHRGAFAFWASMCIFLLLHVLGLHFYFTHVRPLLVWEWVPLILFESFALFFFVDWSTRRFGHVGRRAGWPGRQR